MPTVWNKWSNDKSHDFGIAQNGPDKAASCFIRSESNSSEETLPEPTGSLLQQFKVVDYRGKRLQYSGLIKVSKVDDWAGLTMTIHGIAKDMVAYTTMYREQISGTQDWTEGSLVLDVPKTAYSMTISAQLHGTGCVWFSSLSLKEVGEDVLPTDRHSDACNLDFSL